MSTFDVGPYEIAKTSDRKNLAPDTIDAPNNIDAFFKQNFEDARRVSNAAAYAVNLAEAYDAVNDKIEAATGIKDLHNPLQGEVSPFIQVKRREGARPLPEGKNAYDAWRARIDEFRQSHPDALPWDAIADEPGRKAWERMKSTREATNDLEERLGMSVAQQRPWLGPVDYVVSPAEKMLKDLWYKPGLTAAGFAGGFVGQMVSLPDALINLVGAGVGGKSASIAKNAVLNAAVNMGGQLPLSTLKQWQYKEAGLPYGSDVVTREVAGAGAAGFILDAGVRTAARVPKYISGDTKGLGGFVNDAPKPLPLPDAPPVREAVTPELFEKAQAGDIEAIKEYARRTGVDEDPRIKGAIDYVEMGGKVDDEILAKWREDFIDPVDGSRVFADALVEAGGYSRPAAVIKPAAEPRRADVGERLLLDRAGELQALTRDLDPRIRQQVELAVEAGIPRIVDLVQQRLDEAKTGGSAPSREVLLADIAKVTEELGGPERFAAMVDLYSGQNPSFPRTVEAMRNFPDLIDSNLPMRTDFMRSAMSVSTLEPDAYAKFLAGEVTPQVAKVVADRVPPDQQARVMDDMRKAGIETELDARAKVWDLVKPVRDASDVDTPLSRGSKIDDPAGPEAKAQTDRLMKEHAEAVKEAQAPIKAREKLESEIEDLRGQIAKLEEKAAKAAPAPVERYADPVSGMELSKGEVDSIVDMWAYVRETRKRKPETLTAFLISAGRLQDQGGELTNMLGGKSRHLISGKGMTLDDAALKAQQVGFFTERPDINTFLDAVREDLNGNPHVRDIDFNWLEDFREAQKMEQDLAELGVLKAKSEAEVRDAFRSKPEGEGAQGARGDQAPAGRAEGEAGQVIPEHLFALSSEDLAKIGELHAEVRDLRAQHLEASRGSPLFSLVMDAAAQQRSRDVRQAIGAALRLKQQILPDDVKVEVRADEMRDPTTGNRLDAMSDTLTGDIALAAYALNPAARLGHEAVHTLVTRGNLSPEEVSLLAKAAREGNLFTKETDYREAYKTRAGLDRLIDEEAAAHYVEAIIARRVEPTIPQNLIQKLMQIFERIRNALDGYGFRTETDVVRAIMEGDAAARKSVQAWMRSSDMAAVAVNKQKGKLFAFGGEKAETADRDALARAKGLEASGMDRDNIWKLTGWGRGADGKWRFEIDDSDAGFSAKASLRRKSGPMGERFEHPDLYEAYPALRALDLFWDPELDPKTSLGGFSPDTGVVSLAAKLPSQWTLPVTLHELQHGVQEMERFGRGASMGEMAVSPARVEGWLAGEDGQFLRGTYFERDITMSAAKVIDGFEGGDMLQLQAQVAALIQRGEITLEAAGRKIAQQMQTDAYVRNSGEVEARLVETRMDMTPEQRRERPFWYDYDVLQQEQDVRRRDMLFAMEDGRKARAEAMGFDTSFVAYRGLTHPYDPAVAGDRNWQMFTRSRDAASGYASDLDGANVVPAHLRLGKNLTIDAGGARWDRIPGKAIPYDVKVQARLPMDPVYSVGELARGLRRLGYDSITVANVIDTAHPDQAIVSTVDVVFDPRNIRSVNAEFDPAKADSPNLMYAMDAPRTPLQDDMEAISRLDAFKELVEACR